jgi:hypothetical protein
MSGRERAVALLLMGHYPSMGIERAPVYTNRLQCVECGRVSRESERGPECDEREFGKPS